jgi:branched-chain amino acid transport system substrate-binding protein
MLQVMRALARPGVGLLAVTLGGCSAVLDFDDQCSVDDDCATIDRGLRCDEGMCVPKPLVDPSVGCDRLYGEDPRNAAPGSVLTIGTLLPFTGALGSFGPGMDNAVRLAVDAINQNGGINGVKLGVLGCDSATNPDAAEKAARHLVDVAKVPVIIGPGGSTVAIETFNRVARAARVLMISASATSPAISNLPDDGLLWRTVPSDAIQGEAIAEYMRNRNYRRVVVVNRNDAYGNGLASVVAARFCGPSGPGCTSQNFVTRIYSQLDLTPKQAEDQQKIANELEVIDPDVVVVVGYMSDGLSFLNLAKGKGYPFILTDGMRDIALTEGIKDASDNVIVPGLDDLEMVCGIVGTNPASPAGPLYDAFARAYAANFQADPTTFAAQAYDATWVVALGIAGAFGAGHVAPGGREVAEGIARLIRGEEIIGGFVPPGNFGRGVEILAGSATSTVDYVGVSGALDFDVTVGEASSGIEMWRVDPDTDTILNLGIVFDGKDAYDFSTVAADSGSVSCQSLP